MLTTDIRTFIQYNQTKQQAASLKTQYNVCVPCIDSNFQNKFKKEERANAWRIDKAFSKYSVAQCFTLVEYYIEWILMQHLLVIVL